VLTFVQDAVKKHFFKILWFVFVEISNFLKRNCMHWFLSAGKYICRDAKAFALVLSGHFGVGLGNR
jgi:hypothetical protein